MSLLFVALTMKPRQFGMEAALTESAVPARGTKR